MEKSSSGKGGAKGQGKRVGGPEATAKSISKAEIQGKGKGAGNPKATAKPISKTEDEGLAASKRSSAVLPLTGAGNSTRASLSKAPVKTSSSSGAGTGASSSGAGTGARSSGPVGKASSQSGDDAGISLSRALEKASSPSRVGAGVSSLALGKASSPSRVGAGVSSLALGKASSPSVSIAKSQQPDQRTSIALTTPEKSAAASSGKAEVSVSANQEIVHCLCAVIQFIKHMPMGSYESVHAYLDAIENDIIQVSIRNYSGNGIRLSPQKCNFGYIIATSQLVLRFSRTSKILTTSRNFY
jgi:hypothetical protein